MRAELLARDVPLSDSQIGKLGRKFILYLALAHRRAAPRIREAMAVNGGYILHLDGLHQDDAPALMSGIDALSSLVLANVKVPTEHADQIVPFLEKIKTDYGNPIACVHDMGTGICKAVTAVFAGAKDFICHFHFLRDAGKDLLEPAYRQLRACLRQHAFSTRLSELARQAHQLLAQQADAKAVNPGGADCAMSTAQATYALALWCLQAKNSGDGYGFPFDRPLSALAERVLILLDCLPRLLQTLAEDNLVGNRLFSHLARKVLQVAADPALEKSVDELRWRCKLFDQLRAAMRIADAGGLDGLNDDGGQVEMDSIRDAVGRFRRRLDAETKLAEDPLCNKLAEQIDKYDGKLFAEPIRVQTPSGPALVYPQRTNNILEQFFRSLRRDHRRRTGDNRMHRALQTMLADTPLVKNLSNPHYMQILLDGRP
ncbi:MAG: transposase, partial [Desulfuromonas sp.]